VRDLVKRYPKSTVNAVDGVSFEVGSGEVFGLLGPNGAGKTTTVGMLTTRVRPTGGQAMIDGVDVAAEPVRARGSFAVVPQRSNLDRSISIRRNLSFHAAYHGVPAGQAEARANELLEQFGLRERGDVKPDMFSGGQAQRVMIARALMHEPKVLFLDEPTTGLDPAARLFVWDRLRELHGRGVTLILTTHDMHEAANLASRVGIMDHGRLLALDTPQELMRSLPGSSTLDLTTQVNGTATPEQLLAELGRLPAVERIETIGPHPSGAGGEQAASAKPPPGQPAGNTGQQAEQPPGEEFRVRLYVDGDAPNLVAPAATLLAGKGLSLTGVELGTPTLEDVFIHMTGRTLR
jgi:ABC-2 type transport system ATP-binding protein